MNIRKISLLVLLVLFFSPREVMALHNVTVRGQVYFWQDGRKVPIPGVVVQRFDSTYNQDHPLPVSVTDGNGGYEFNTDYTKINGEEVVCDNGVVGSTCKMSKLGESTGNIRCYEASEFPNETNEEAKLKHVFCGYACLSDLKQRWFAYFPTDFDTSNIDLPAGTYIDTQDKKGGGDWNAIINPDIEDKTYYGCVPDGAGNSYGCCDPMDCRVCNNCANCIDTCGDDPYPLILSDLIIVGETAIEAVGYDMGEAFESMTLYNAGFREDVDFEWIPPNRETLACMVEGCGQVGKECGDGLVCEGNKCVSPDCPSDDDCSCSFGCNSLTPNGINIDRREGRHFVCTIEGDVANYARMRIEKDGEVIETSEYIELDEDSEAIWDYEISENARAGDYIIKCQACIDSEGTNCTSF